MAVDKHLLDLGVGAGMGWHGTVSDLIGVERIIKLHCFFVSL